MPTSKTRKSITKRFKITKSGKILRRSVGQDHLLSKQTGKQRRSKRKWREVPKAEVRILLKNLKYVR
ncbi:MAG TPA: 50S ribosomal protein L35 [Candidatus Pacearchaeota archaeon]|nr:50S ribosomal protein L35 [Candidatus Parcubacteria bacterium]HOU46128.1 50S ribosomal protein L35 [Candidatus Pacearchaeota archaeon]HQI74868.1 50S ribosomal protein L35 [Candidatus Pacearchaeota archaeon]